MKRIIRAIVIISLLLTVATSVSYAAATVSVNADVNNRTKVVTITGSISSSQGQQVSVRVINPSGGTDYINQADSGANGGYRFTYTLDEAVGGTYSVTVGGTGISSPVATTFTYTPETSGGGSSGGGNGSVTITPVPTPVPTPTPTPEPAKLNDVAGHWAEGSINKLIASGAVSGYPDGSFKPNNNITRAEFVKILVLAFKLEMKPGKVFSDAASHWAKDYIATANAYGIVSGYSDTVFGPNDLITREQMAVMIVKVAKLVVASEDMTFSDKADMSDWSKGAIAAAKKNGIIVGYPDMSFKPLANATRAEAVTVIVKAMGIK